MLQSLLEGKTDELPGRVCDVRDVARAHVKAIEDPSASGRYIISQPNNVSPKFIVDALKKRFPDYKKLHGKEGDSSPIIDNSKVCHSPLSFGEMTNLCDSRQCLKNAPSQSHISA